MIEIKVRCRGAESLALDELTPLQNELKTLTKENFDKLKESLIQKGFWFPFFVWVEPKSNKKYYIDGHQRDRVLHILKDEPNFILPDKYPVIYIEAKNKKEAAEAILLQSSAYGIIEPDNLYKFMSEFQLDTRVLDNLNFDHAFGSVEEFKKAFFEEFTAENKEKEIDETTLETDHECPNCGYKWS